MLHNSPGNLCFSGIYSLWTCYSRMQYYSQTTSSGTGVLYIHAPSIYTSLNPSYWLLPLRKTIGNGSAYRAVKAAATPCHYSGYPSAPECDEIPCQSRPCVLLDVYRPVRHNGPSSQTAGLLLSTTTGRDLRTVKRDV